LLEVEPLRRRFEADALSAECESAGSFRPCHEYMLPARSPRFANGQGNLNLAVKLRVAIAPGFLRGVPQNGALGGQAFWQEADFRMRCAALVSCFSWNVG
jgi:hypothetical protein